MQQFPLISRAQWLEKALLAAKGKAFDGDAALQGRISGLRAFRAKVAPWVIFQRIDNPAPERALAQARDDLAGGAGGLILANAELAGVLSELPLHGFSLRNEAGDDGARAILRIGAKQPIDPARLAIDFGVSDQVLLRELFSQGFTGPYLRADGRPSHLAGATDGEELGLALAEGVASLRSLENSDDALLSRAVSLTLSATQSIFDTMAKFRAARILWSEILNAAKLPVASLSLHGETSRNCLATEDAHSNILRIATSAFAAGLGGADSFSALPHSFNQGIANDFSRRVARNAQLLLEHESQLWRVADPAAGAGAIERRTEQICDEAWSTLQARERGEHIQLDPKRQRSAPLIGVSLFKNAKTYDPDIEAVT